MPKASTKARRVRKVAPKRKAEFKPCRLSVRCTEDMQDAIETAREESGRTFSGEVEHQLARALFEWGTGPTHAVMTAIGRAIDSVARMQLDERGGWARDSRARWWRDPYLFTQAAQAILAALDILRPQGAVPEDRQELLDLGGPRQGRFAIESVLQDVQLVDPSTPPAEQSPRAYAYWRWLCWLKEDLGFLADTLTVRGRNTRQMQYLRDRSAEFRDELIVLSREAGRLPEGMSMAEYQNISREELEARNLTPEKRKRLGELRQRLAHLKEEIEQ